MEFKGVFSGFADEAGSSIDAQIRATKELGWSNIEARNIDGKNIHDLSDEAFDVVYGKLDEAGVKVHCFGSAIANWGKKIDEPFDSSVEEAKRAIVRMKRLDTRYIRIMSFAVLKDREADNQMEEERFRRVRELHKMFTDEDLVPVHENCMNYGGMGYRYTLRLLENVPGLKLVFDPGNAVMSDDRGKPKPHPKQSSYTFYSMVKEHIEHVHIKDGIFDGEMKYTYGGEGHGDVPEILEDLLSGGYTGGLSIEPHLAVVFHDESVESKDDVRFNNYVEYGRRLMKLVDSL